LAPSHGGGLEELTMSGPGLEPPTPEVVILCGGRGTRLGPETDARPKPLVQVGGRPILWYVMAHYASYGFKRFVLCLGYKGEMIRDYFLNYHLHNNDFTVRLGDPSPSVIPHLSDVLDWEVTCAETGLTAMTGARIRRVEKYIRSPYFLCTYGDGISDVDLRALVDFHHAHGRLATVTGVHQPARFGELVLEGDSRVAQFAEKPKLNPRIGGAYVNGGFFVFDRSVFDYLPDEDDCILERAPLESLAADDQLRVFKHEGFWQCMDTPKDRDALDELLSSHSSLGTRDGSTVGSRPSRNGQLVAALGR
jgi:glucose-1-phosphate cytidylyltransferase